MTPSEDDARIAKMRDKLLRDARDCLGVLRSCLDCYYDGETHMYKPIAGQLRMLFCDGHEKKDHSLLGRLWPDIQLPAFKPVIWERLAGGLAFGSPPFVIRRTRKGIEDMSIDLEAPQRTVSLRDWLDHKITCDPDAGSVREIIRLVADKDGGAHFDNEAPAALLAMKRVTLEARKNKVLFVIALAKYAIAVVEPMLARDDAKG